MPYLLDSDVLIDYTRANPEAEAYLAQLTDRAISQVTTMELLVGARDKRDAAYLDDLFTEFAILPLTEQIGRRAYDLLKTYAKSHGLHVFDSLIAAAAIESNLTLVTKNRKHFEMIEGLDVRVPGY